MGETQGNRVIHQNGQSPHHKYHLQLKTKEDIGGVVWNFKRVEDNSLGDTKVSVSGLCRDEGTKNGL